MNLNWFQLFALFVLGKVSKVEQLTKITKLIQISIKMLKFEVSNLFGTIRKGLLRFPITKHVFFSANSALGIGRRAARGMLAISGRYPFLRSGAIRFQIIKKYRSTYLFYNIKTLSHTQKLQSVITYKYGRLKDICHFNTFSRLISMY